MNVTIVGVGGLGGALAAGLIGAVDVDLCVCARRSASLEAWRGRARTSLELTAAVAGADVVIVAVKPKHVLDVVAQLGPALTAGALVVSCAAGVSFASLQAVAPVGVAIARAMPNIGATRRASTTGVLLGPGTDAARDRARVRTVFAAVGDVFEVVDEAALHVVTATAASGPAFLLLAVEAMVDAGVEHGLTRADALVCARGALQAAAARLERDVEPSLIRGHVTSPGGTTAAGLAALERGATRHAFRDAVAAAIARSIALS
jgi:pyrroline-5-carboxylate reductase